MRTTIDAGGINEQQLKQLQPNTQRQLSALSQLLGTQTGATLSAQVQNIAPVSIEARALLVKVATEELATLNPKSSAPAVQKLIQALNERIQLLQSPDLKLAELQVVKGMSDAKTVSLLVYTRSSNNVSNPLVVGAQLQLTLTSEQQLLFTPALSTATASKDIISQALRALLPQKDQGLDVLTKLPQLLKTLEQLPTSARAQWLSNELQSALQQLNRQLPSAGDLSSPLKLSQHIKLSGINFEHNLAASIAKTATSSLSASTSASTAAPSNLTTQVSIVRGVSPNLTTAPVNNLTNPLIVGGSASNAPTTASPLLKSLSGDTGSTALLTKELPLKTTTANHLHSEDKRLTQDLKGALLGLRQTLAGELTQASHLLPADTLVQSSLLNKTPAQQLMLLLGQMGNHHLPELSQKVLRAQLVMLLQQQTFGSLAKIQLQQLHSLNHQQAQADQPQASQSWQVEIPMRQGTEVFPLQLHLERHWLEEKDVDKKLPSTASKQRQWNVMLTFDLPKLGQFCAQLTLVGCQLSATLWAEREATLTNTRNLSESLKSQLEQQGLEVTQLQCLKGSPSQPKMTLSYSLVDIKT